MIYIIDTYTRFVLFFLLKNTPTSNNNSLFDYIKNIFFYNTFISFFILLLYFWIFLFIVSLYKTALTSPGYLNDVFTSEIKEISLPIMSSNLNSFMNQFEKTSMNGPLTRDEFSTIINAYHHLISNSDNIDIRDSMILCSSCLRWKQERTHHCKKCDKCVRKMDHHCPWIGNCIGEYNYKYFILTIIYGFLSSFTITLIYPKYIIHILKINPFSFCIYISFSYACILILFGFSLYLIITNFDCVIHNITLIEKAEYERFIKTNPIKNNDFNKRISYQIRHRYDKGIIRNIKEIFGDSYLLWFFPI